MKPGEQLDISVHDMTGFTKDSYGLVCSSHDGAAGEIDGRMVHYRSDGTGYQFAFAMPMTNGKNGSQFVSFNTFQPSADSVDSKNLVANWIQVTNLSDSVQSGEIIAYGMDGTRLVINEDCQSDKPTLAPGSRFDFGAHCFGTSLVGTVEFRPMDAEALFLVRNVRYLYDNGTAAPSFDTAFQLEGMHGTGELVVVPLDTRGATSIIEILNTSDEAISATVTIYDDEGNQKGDPIELAEWQLPAHGAWHVITDGILGPDARGLATIQGSELNSLAAVTMQYSRDAKGGIDNMYGVPAIQALGTSIRGSYNTFINQESELVLLNSSNADKDVTVDIVDLNGASLLSGEVINVPTHGLTTLIVNTVADPNEYGAVTLKVNSNSVVAWVLRHRGQQYTVPTPAR